MPCAALQRDTADGVSRDADEIVVDRLRPGRRVGLVEQDDPALEVAAQEPAPLVPVVQRRAQAHVEPRPPVVGRAADVGAERVGAVGRKEVRGQRVLAPGLGLRVGLVHDALAGVVQPVDLGEERAQAPRAVAARDAGVVHTALDVDEVGRGLLAADVGIAVSQPPERVVHDLDGREALPDELDEVRHVAVPVRGGHGRAGPVVDGHDDLAGPVADVRREVDVVDVQPPVAVAQLPGGLLQPRLAERRVADVGCVLRARPALARVGDVQRAARGVAENPLRVLRRPVRARIDRLQVLVDPGILEPRQAVVEVRGVGERAPVVPVQEARVARRAHERLEARPEVAHEADRPGVGGSDGADRAGAVQRPGADGDGHQREAERHAFHRRRATTSA